ncbi:MAG: hypothetical protein ACRD3Q_17205, partial [Terriglobales bacterium]
RFRLTVWVVCSFGSLSQHANIESVANAGEPTLVPATGTQAEDRLSWIGVDDRGVELEILGVETPEYVLIIHVMPTAFRKGR